MLIERALKGYSRIIFSAKGEGAPGAFGGRTCLASRDKICDAGCSFVFLKNRPSFRDLMEIKKSFLSVCFASFLSLFPTHVKPLTWNDLYTGFIGAMIGATGVVVARAFASSLFRHDQHGGRDVPHFALPIDGYQGASGHFVETHTVPCVIAHEKTLNDFVGQKRVISEVEDFLDEV